MNISEIINKRTLEEIVEFLRSRNLDDREIRFGINHATNTLKNLPKKFKIYRIVALNNPSELETEKLGAHWTLNKENLLDSYNITKDKKYCLITAKITEDRVILRRTFELNVEYPNEMEILVDNDGRNLDIISIECF
jgi:hypothetical protein